MKVSHEWLQTFFEKPLPSAMELADALTFHAFEIESVENDILDVKVTPNRGHDCLSHRGIAKELSAILNVPMKSDPLRETFDVTESEQVKFDIEDSGRVLVSAVAYMRGVKIGASPEWLRKRLEAIGQRSINNVVDATNYVMFDIGCPTHAFDADSFKEGNGIRYGIRTSKKGETLQLLGGKAIALSGNEAVIVNAQNEAVDIGGVKGGALAELRADSSEIVLSASKFEPTQTRKAAQRFNQRTEAAKRFENEIPDELSVYGIQMVAKLIQEIAGGEIVGRRVERARPSVQRKISVSLEKINGSLGIQLRADDVVDVFKRLDLKHERAGELFTILPPFERLDLEIEEDIVEEVGRIVGYDKIVPSELPPLEKQPDINHDFYAAEKKREELIAKGYSEVFTSVFAEEGERIVANKVDGVRPFLRTSLIPGLTDALERNRRVKDVLGVSDVKLFEIGAVWKEGKEATMLGIADEKGVREEPLMYRGDASIQTHEDLPLSSAERYQPFSKYPFISRDIAMWTPAATREEDVLEMIRKNAGELLVKEYLFDRFEKQDKVSLAFRLIFQSFDRTLTDFDANERMESISNALKAAGFKIR